MPDDLHALDHVFAVREINALDKEETTLGPLVGNFSVQLSGLSPRANQSVQAFQVWIGFQLFIHHVSPSTLNLPKHHRGGHSSRSSTAQTVRPSRRLV